MTVIRKPALRIHPRADEPLRDIVRQLNEVFAREEIRDGEVTTAKLADSSVTSAKIADGTIATADIADNAITTGKITDANVTTAKIAADAIDGTKIADDAVANEHIAAGAVDTTELAANAVDATILDEAGSYTMAGLTMSGNVDLDGNDLILDSDGDTLIRSGVTDDVIIFWTFGGERARFNGAGDFLIAKTVQNTATQGFQYDTASGITSCTANTSQPLICNRQSNDGDVIQIRQGNTTEGSISVSGTTVSYNGAHLSRWAQMAGHDGPAPDDILPGTVMSNADELCERPHKNEFIHLNKVKVSDAQGDINVTGVFEASETNNDDTHWDFTIAQIGDYFVRIGKGVIVHMGDELVSAGDGTAHANNNAHRAALIGKVRCSKPIKTYDDGSYLVAASLMM